MSVVPGNAAAMTAAAHSRMSKRDLVELTCALVNAGDPDEPWNTIRACEVLVQTLGPQFGVDDWEPEPGHRSVLAAHTFPEPGPALLFCGHLDVVPADG